jgi:membrane protein implicated in regulation of membrane protease activity
MSIGTGVVLFVIGAILVFALNFETEIVNLDLVGYILMGAGFVVFVIGLVLLARRRQAVTTSRSGTDAVTGERVEQRVTEMDDPADRVV